MAETSKHNGKDQSVIIRKLAGMDPAVFTWQERTPDLWINSPYYSCVWSTVGLLAGPPTHSCAVHGAGPWTGSTPAPDTVPTWKIAHVALRIPSLSQRDGLEKLGKGV